MRPSRNILVALDSGEMSESLQQHTALFANKLGVKKIVGVHVVPVLKIMDVVTVDARDLTSPAAPAIEVIRDKVEDQVSVFEKCCKNAETSVLIREGQPFPNLVEAAKKTEADLLIMGRKKVSSGSGITAKKIARKVEADLLFVPERSSTTIEHIMVAVDFSENSARALEKALYLAEKLHVSRPITCLNILDVPPISRVGDLEVFNLAGKTTLEIGKERYDKFVSKYELDKDRLEPLYVESWDEELGQTIRSTAHEIAADLVMVGARGHNILERFFLGSVTEHLVELDEDHLIWVVR